MEVGECGGDGGEVKSKYIYREGGVSCVGVCWREGCMVQWVWV